MPLLEFRCAECGHQFELLIRGSESHDCPKCGGKRPEKLLSAGRVRTSLPIGAACPPPEAGPCGPGCCRLPS